MGPYLRNLVTNLFGGSPKTAVQTLLEENQIDDEELAAIRDVIDTYGKKEDDRA